MEKVAGATVSDFQLHPRPPQRGRKTHWRLHIAILICLAYLSYYLYSRIPNEPEYEDRSASAKFPAGTFASEDFAWAKITPVKHLEYTPCYDGFQCARLDVPMDYNSTDPDAPRVAVAVIRYTAPVPVIAPGYGGAILLNPGGPGGSGVQLALGWAKTISKIVNPRILNAGPDAKYFDIVSFDPRGVNNTTPHIDCFPSSFSHDIFKLQILNSGIGSPEARSAMWARSKALASTCSEHGSELLHHMNTVPVVNDMVSIIEAHGSYREKAAEEWMATPSWINSTKELPLSHPYAPPAIRERTRWQKGQEKLLYWGFSYGTLLGSTFAALQPQRVHRVIIDGVCDATDYYATGWLSNLRDTDKIMLKFYEYCSLSNSTTCPINLHSNSTAVEIQALVEGLTESVKEDPIPVLGTDTRGAEIITYSDIMDLVKDVLYTPLQDFPLQARLLGDLIHGNGSLFADHKASFYTPSCPLSPKTCEPNNRCEIPTDTAGAGIMCSDGLPLEGWTKKTWLERVNTLLGQSKWMGEYWSSITVHCVGWKGKARWGIRGEDVKGVTASPMLLIGNTLDPVTPLYNAFLMKDKFPGSEVLTQNSEGHCSISSPSLCTVKAIRTYFQTGTLPPPNATCQPEQLPLLGAPQASTLLLDEEGQSIEDRELIGALREMRNLDLSAVRLK